jgi:hypothetical protein
MAEAKNYTFTYKEIAEALVKAQGLHEGLWGAYLQFGIGAANIPTGPSNETLIPAAIVPVLNIGIQRFEQPNSLTVDAAEVNPPPQIGTKLGKWKQVGKKLGVTKGKKTFIEPKMVQPLVR